MKPHWCRDEVTNDCHAHSCRSHASITNDILCSVILLAQKCPRDGRDTKSRAFYSHLNRPRTRLRYAVIQICWCSSTAVYGWSRPIRIRDEALALFPVYSPLQKSLSESLWFFILHIFLGVFCPKRVNAKNPVFVHHSRRSKPIKALQWR